MPATPLREDVRRRLRQDLLEGRLAPGEQIRLAQLAERLSVSMTPAREALTQLETEGWVVARPNRGFFVPAMTMAEAESIYPLLSTLEGLAVELQGPIPTARLRELRELNQQMAERADQPARAFAFDLRWHLTLVRGCPNGLVLEHLRSVRSLAERYERAYMRSSGRIPFSLADHERIVEALEQRQDKVPAMLRKHWALSLDFVRSWLERPPGGEES
jgi:DNA-binding GntR family transcriptional regulator